MSRVIKRTFTFSLQNGFSSSLYQKQWNSNPQRHAFNYLKDADNQYNKEISHLKCCDGP